MNILLSPNGVILVVVLAFVLATLIAIGAVWLMARTFDLFHQLGWTEPWPSRATPAIAEGLLKTAQAAHFEDDVNAMDLEAVKQYLERELPAKFGFQKREPSLSENRVSLEVHETVSQFFEEWGDLEGIGLFCFSLGPSHVEDWQNGVFEIGSSDASFAVVVATSAVVFERENDSQLDWDITPVAKTVYHFALRLCRESSDEDDDEA